MSIFVIGDQNTVLGFALVGVEGEVVESVAEARAALERTLAQGDHQIVLMTRQWTGQMQPELDQLKLTTLEPVIVEIPGSREAPPAQSLRQSIEKTIGIRLG